MSYIWLRAIHVIVDFTWGATLFAISLLGSLEFLSPSPSRHRTLQRVNNWLAFPCMIVVWVAGARLAYVGGWIGDLWLSIKLSLVVILSLYQIILTMELNVYKKHLVKIQIYRFYIAMTILIIVSIIIVLVMMKPN